MLRKFVEPARSCFLQPYRVCSPVRVYFHATQVRRGCSHVLHANLPSLLTRASLLSCFARSPSLLGRASCNLIGSAHRCEFTFMLRKVAEPARSCFLQPYRVCSPVRVYFHAPGLLTCGSLLSCFASSRSLLARASFDLAGSPHPCDFTFILPKFVETAGSFFMRPSQVYSPVRVYFHNSQVRGACSLVLLAPLPSLLTRASVTLPGLLTRASLLSCFASLPRLLARSSCDLDGSALPCEFTITIHKYAEPARSCFLRPGRVCSPVRVYFHASQGRRARP
ncbi:hypothetical protein CDL15_Pgr010568 [Punica granatum]|uniref:Uncharacterized protein n=1 Tax=Punica granatum TaxID=22663 RepID=A0A218XH69_PUNGR|nr:hypothetical protein CDL15_Pgr010568 [Punica granatum]